MQLRGNDLAPEAADEIEAARGKVLALLSPDAAPGATSTAPSLEALADMPVNNAMTILARRLAHIEHAAEKVARLAARPILDDQA
jgi:hypothetical protein